jgi:FkbM family methyltransferase
MWLRRLARLLSVLPDGIGAFRLANAIYKRRLRSLSRGARVERARLSDGSTFELDLSDWTQAQAFLLRRYEEATVRFITERMNGAGRPVFIDGGAHIGLMTFQVAARTPGLTVHAFEPCPWLAQRLRRNAANNPGAHVIVEERALSATSGTLWIPASDEFVSVDTTASQEDEEHSLAIEAVSLDDYLDAERIERVDVLKVDLEGNELLALQGAGRALAAGRIGCVVVEIIDVWRERAGDSREELTTFLVSHGYRPQTIRPLRLSRHPVEEFAFTRDRPAGVRPP